LAWDFAFRSTFRLYPDPAKPQDQLDIFLSSDGLRDDEVLARLPYHRERAASPGQLPDAKRYRDGRQLFRTVGLLYDERTGANEKRLRVTALGRAVARWRPVINPRNAPVLGRHVAHALAACQLRNPLGESKYGADVEVFPFAFIWRAMIALDGRISSDELNRAIMHSRNEEDLASAIERIANYRVDGDLAKLGPPLVTEEGKNDRILVWMSWASFGWTLILDKRTTGTSYYSIAPNAQRIVNEAARLQHRHRSFASESAYVEHISNCAGLPEDLR
jgi:hypothetical protein